MSRKRILQIGATVVIVCGAVGYLLASGIAGGEYYKHVDEIMQNPQAWQGKRLQVHGRVVKSSIQRRLTGTLPEYKFQIENGGKVIDAHYAGVVPDTFKDEAEVVCKGKLTARTTLEVSADGVMAKCPSKYEAKKLPAVN
ncbi:MAG TPA: cytochrome c maturation protein CcmE [Polyangia bacterium]|nr:cytochrome c maturation protein CcmE [Polyangia bacterium]